MGEDTVKSDRYTFTDDLGEKKWVSVSEMAEILGISKPTAHSWVEDTPELRIIRKGGILRIYRDDLEEMIAAMVEDSR